MQGYYDDPEATAAAVDAEGWMHSGDLVTLDAEGYCNIVGRCADGPSAPGCQCRGKWGQDSCFCSL